MVIFNATWHHKQFSWTQNDITITQMNRQVSLENQKEIVRVIMFVQDKFALALHDHTIVVITIRGDQYSENNMSFSARFFSFTIFPSLVLQISLLPSVFLSFVALLGASVAGSGRIPQQIRGYSPCE